MTPAVAAARKAAIDFRLHAYSHDPENEDYGKEAAERLGLPAERVFKTLLVRLDNGGLVVALVPVSGLLNLKSVARAAGTKKATMANAHDAQRATGYVLGGISPLGQKKRLPTFIDQDALKHESLFVSGGRRGLEIELKPQDLARLTAARFVPLRQQ
jgi:Cys-tRNA(Pro)/Cys-tRNA(Cys) deacylase